jgi:hypothetical protein
LVEMALPPPLPARRDRNTASKASEMAAKEIDRIADKSATDEERTRRKRRLLEGPTEFREFRSDRPKQKGSK